VYCVSQVVVVGITTLAQPMVVLEVHPHLVALYLQLAERAVLAVM
jgi:hypothetical protein